MIEIESVMQRLSEQSRALNAQLAASEALDEESERALTVKSLALVSEAVLKIGRDIRQIRLQLAEKN
jgi:hypothetical protein